MSSRLYTKRLYKKRPKQGPLAPERPKAFKSEASAQEWAKENGLKKFKIEAVGKLGNKFKIRTVF